MVSLFMSCLVLVWLICVSGGGRRKGMRCSGWGCCSLLLYLRFFFFFFSFFFVQFYFPFHFLSITNYFFLHQWFFTLFTYETMRPPTPTLLWIWDNLFTNGRSFLFFVALALFRLCKPQLLTLRENGLLFFFLLFYYCYHNNIKKKNNLNQK